jgi:hypothetical protein
MRGCASTTRTARALEFGREEAVARASRGEVYACVNHSLAPPLIFIEHANGLCHCMLISTLIWVGSNPYMP